MKRTTCCLVLTAVLCLILAVPAFAAEKVLMSIGGGMQRIPVLQLSDTQSPGGNAKAHHELKVTKEVETASAQLLTALATKEVLKEVVFEFLRTDLAGVEVIYFKLTLTNAKIAGIRQIAGAATGDRSKRLEEISFTFQKMERSTASGQTMGVWGK